MSAKVGVGIIGGGLMGRELAGALARWCVLKESSVEPELVAVADPLEPAREWFRRIPSVRCITADYRELLARPEVDVVYVAVPHHLHESIYRDVLRAGKDLLAEKPFGIDLSAAESIVREAETSGRFVRCSSEFPFYPGANRAYEMARSEAFGKMLEVRSGFWHSSDLDGEKPINWKRQVKTCGAIGVMGDLGMHAVHLPFRLGWHPKRVYAQLQKVYPTRPDGRGGVAACDTWDNALLHTEVDFSGMEVPMRIEMKRLAPGATNTWYFEAFGTEGGVRFSTTEPRTVWVFQRKPEQAWQRIDIGYQTAFPTVTGSIFEAGFPDCLLQMWAAFFEERAGKLGDRLGCVTPKEAVASHRLFAAALESHGKRAAVELGGAY